MTNPKLGWVAWEADGTNGYGHVSMKFRQGLQELGAEFTNAYTGGWDLLVAICTPTAWMVPGHKKRDDLVIHTMFEAEPLPPGWVQNMNAAGCIWTPSDYCKNVFEASGVKTPIFKTPYGIDLTQYTYVNRRNRSGPMRFGIWADSLISRKNTLKAAWAFIDAALPDAELEIKLHSYVGMNDQAAFADKDGRPLANVTIHAGAWPRPKLIKWLESIDCMIYLSGGEGFGLMPLEAAATGLTTVVHNCTGMTEYLNPDAFLLVESEKKELAMTYSIGYGYQAFMPKPNYEQAVEQIRWAYNNRDALCDKGDEAARQAQEWTWARANEAAWKNLRGYYNAVELKRSLAETQPMKVFRYGKEGTTTREHIE